MKEETRKEIEAKLHQLIAKIDNSQKPESTPQTTLLGVKIIRRRKGHLDMAVA